MKITLANIKTLLNLSTNDYDNKISLLLPQIISSIINYCNNDFNLYLFESGSIIFSPLNNTITLTWDSGMPIEPGDHINIRGSKYNDKTLQVKSFENRIITLEDNNTIRLETYSCGINICDLPPEFLIVVVESIKANLSMRDKSISKEIVDDVEYDYIQGSNGLLLQSSASTLNNYRKVYRHRCLNEIGCYGGDC